MTCPHSEPNPAHKGLSRIMRPLAPRSLTSVRHLLVRSASTVSDLPPSSVRSPVSPTTFSEKASPRNVHERPEAQRGLPPTSKIPRPTEGLPVMNQDAMDAFEGPSRPRLLNDRTGRRELPQMKVSCRACFRYEAGLTTFLRIECPYVRLPA